MPIDLLSTARELIAIDSRSSLSDRAVVDYLAPLCRAAGLTVSLQDELRDGVTQWNLLATRGGDAAPAEGPATGRALRLLLATHLDTVPPGDEAGCRVMPLLSFLPARGALPPGLPTAPSWAATCRQTDTAIATHAFAVQRCARSGVAWGISIPQ